MGKTVLQINVDLNSGSTGHIVEDIGKLLINKGYQSYAAYGDDFTNSISNPVKIGTRTSFYFHALQTRLFDSHGFGSIHATKQFVLKIIEINPDIIHLHNIHGYYLNIELLFDFLREFGKPIVWTFHDCWPITGHCAFFTSANCHKWKSGCYKCPLTRSYPKSLFVDNSKQNYKIKKNLFSDIKNLHITTVSHWLHSVVRESFLGKYPIVEIKNGIDLNIFKSNTSNKNTIREEFSIGNRYMILGVASRWGERKGFNDFLRLSQRIDSDSIIVLIGLSKQQISDLPKQIIGISKIENVYRLANFYSAADVFVNPSRAETFGMVNAEAMACGTPVVAYKNTASPEIVGNKEGILVEDGNTNALFEAITTVRNIGKIFYTENCRKKVFENFNKSINYLQYLQLYEKMIKSDNLREK